MGKTRTSEEIKNEMIKVLGQDFGSLLFTLHNEITWLTFRWIEFKELYGTKESRIELMNEVAPFFFFTIQKILRENLMLGISRITDPSETFGKKNASIKGIPAFITDDFFKKELEKDIKEIIESATFCRDWRNRWIAHLDFELAINNQSAKPLESATREKLKLTIEKIQDFYNKVEFKFLNSKTAFKYLSSHKGAISLLYSIENGQYFSKLRYDKKLSGDWNFEDIKSKV